MIDQSAIDAVAEDEVAPGQLLIDGASMEAGDGGRREVITPLDGSTLTTIPEATPADVDRAVSAARHAFEDGRWSRRSPAGRMAVMHRFADLIEANAVELTVLGVRDNGTEIGMALRAEAGSAARTIRYYAECIDKVCGEVAPTAHDVVGLVQREPIGVVGVIVPWNFPLMIGTWKIGPALAMGNSIVVKPAETASLSLLRLVELAHEAGVPAGVINAITGGGASAGAALAGHPDVDVIAFTGSGSTGRQLLEYSARSNLKAVHLELGGKSPNIVFADASDLGVAATAAVKGIFRNSGQVCVAGSRLLVETAIFDEFISEVMSVARTLRVGNPLSLESDVGAVHSADQLAKNLSMLAQAEGEGVELRLGGGRLHEGTGGFYMEPTLLVDQTGGSSVAREEVFGPVLVAIPFESADDAVRIANDTVYGLASGVWTSDLSTAHRMSRQIRAGTVYVNTYGGADVAMPMAGVKQSGNSVDKSLHALDKYTNLKAVWIHI